MHFVIRILTYIRTHSWVDADIIYGYITTVTAATYTLEVNLETNNIILG